jgi:hypothetical protein
MGAALVELKKEDANGSPFLLDFCFFDYESFQMTAFRK